MPGNGTDLADRVHGHVGGGGAVKEDGHHRGVIRVEALINFLWYQLHGNGEIGDGVIPKNRLHVVYLRDLLFYGCHVLRLHVVEDEEGEGTLTKFLHEFLLAGHRLHVLGKVIQHVIVYSCAHVTQGGGYHQDHRDDQNGNAVFHHRVCKFHDVGLAFQIVFL